MFLQICNRKKELLDLIRCNSEAVLPLGSDGKTTSNYCFSLWHLIIRRLAFIIEACLDSGDILIALTSASSTLRSLLSSERLKVSSAWTRIMHEV
jgi:hypothetical protein